MFLLLCVRNTVQAKVEVASRPKDAGLQPRIVDDPNVLFIPYSGFVQYYGSWRKYQGIHCAYSKSFTSSMVKPVISAIMSHANP